MERKLKDNYIPYFLNWKIIWIYDWLNEKWDNNFFIKKIRKEFWLKHRDFDDYFDFIFDTSSNYIRHNFFSKKNTEQNTADLSKLL